MRHTYLNKMAMLLGVSRILATRGVVSAVAACPRAAFISQPSLQVRYKGHVSVAVAKKQKQKEREEKYVGWKGVQKTGVQKTGVKKTVKKIKAAKAGEKKAATQTTETNADAQTVKKVFKFTKAKTKPTRDSHAIFAQTGRAKYDFMRKGGAPILHLVDASDWIYRSFYAMPPFLKKHGTPTGAVIGFSSSLVTLMSSLRPGDMIGLAFDAGKTWRNSEMPTYKTGRKSPPNLRLQIPECRRAAEALLGEQHCLSVPGMEADDIIAEIVKGHRPAMPYTIAIHTRDQDFLQLVTENITVVRKFKGAYERVGPKEVDEHFGLPPEQLACYWALVGQAADSVSGVPGVGPKTAKGIIKALGNLESVFDPKHQYEHPPPRGRIHNTFQMSLHSYCFCCHRDMLEEACGTKIALTLPEHERTCILGRRIMQLPSPHPPVTCWDGKKPKPTEELAYEAKNFEKGDEYLAYWGFNSLKKQYAKTMTA